MSRCTLRLVLPFCGLLFTTTAFAQTAAAPTQEPLLPQIAGVVAASTAAEGSQAPIARAAAPDRMPFRRGLIPLFASFATLQALDVHSTLTVIDRGGFERNPIAAPFVNHPAAFVAFKAGMTTATFLAATRLSRRNRVGAYALMAGMNAAYAIVVAHNYRVAAQLR